MLKFIISIFLLSASYLLAQDFTSGRISGNVQIDAAYYTKDSTIGAQDVPEKILSNAFLNLIYNLHDFEIGMRYESYLNPILGFDTRFKGQGIFYRYITYTSELLDITAGGFYEQFGSGLIFRAYEERQLGIDNMVDGARFKIRPVEGITITGLIGKQRSFWSYGKGIVRAGDISISLNDIFGDLIEGYLFEIGASAVSRNEQDLSPHYKLPENVFSWSTRASIAGESFNVGAEFAYKYNDPNATNNFNYNSGIGLIFNAAYFTEGIGASLNFHTIDNMDYRNERTALGNELFLNFIPPLTKQHLYRLTLYYPYATQLNSEMGLQGEFTFRIPKGSFLGGNFGTDIIINCSILGSIDTSQIEIDTTTGYALRYNSNIFEPGEKLFYRDINIEIQKRWSKELKTSFEYVNLVSDRDALENQGGSLFGKIHANIAVFEFLYKLFEKHSLRLELQHLWFRQDSIFNSSDFRFGNWFVGLLEYTFAPNFYLTFWDEFNYFDTQRKVKDLSGNTILENFSRRLHYPSVSFAYVQHATRVSLTYGRVVGGLLCVGGICRPVPPSNGLSLSVTSSF